MKIIKKSKDIVQGLYREYKKNQVRSPQWQHIRKEFINKNPICAACSSKLLLQVHHITPFHENPSLELDENNLITLCIYNLCHLKIGHGTSYKTYNPNILKHIKLIKEGKSLEEIRELAIKECSLNDGPDKG